MCLATHTKLSFSEEVCPVETDKEDDKNVPAMIVSKGIGENTRLMNLLQKLNPTLKFEVCEGDEDDGWATSTTMLVSRGMSEDSRLMESIRKLNPNFKIKISEKEEDHWTNTNSVNITKFMSDDTSPIFETCEEEEDVVVKRWKLRRRN